jgi:hypothetical protein
MHAMQTLMNVRRILMDVSKNVPILMVVIIALVVLGTLWQLMTMAVMVSANNNMCNSTPWSSIECRCG